MEVLLLVAVPLIIVMMVDWLYNWPAFQAWRGRRERRKLARKFFRDAARAERRRQQMLL